MYQTTTFVLYKVSYFEHATIAVQSNGIGKHYRVNN